MSVWEAKLISSRICPSHLASAVAFFQSQMKVETEKRRPPQPWPIVKTKAVPNPNSGSTISAALPTSVNTDSRVGWRWQDSHGESGSAVRSSPPPPRPAPARRGPRPAQSNDLSFEFIVCYAHTYTWPPSSLPPSHSAFASPASLAIATDDSSSLLSFLASLPPFPLPQSVSHTNLTPNSATHELAAANAQAPTAPPAAIVVRIIQPNLTNPTSIAYYEVTLPGGRGRRRDARPARPLHSPASTVGLFGLQPC